MKIEKTESGYFLSVGTDNGGHGMPISYSEYLQLRDHFAKEIAEGLSDEMITAEFNSRIFHGFVMGAKWLRSQITGSKPTPKST